MTRLRFAVAGLLASISAGQAGAINIVLDYSYDTQGFFNNATAKATLEKAAADLSAILTDTMPAMSAQTDYVGTFDTFRWSYTLNFTHPGNNGLPIVELPNVSIAANEYRVYAGGRSIAGSTLGKGGSGGLNWSYGTVGGGGGSYYQNEIDDINVITPNFTAMIEGRDSTISDFRAWGGSITFDNNSGTNWHYDWQTEPTSGQSDLYSVALHELMHAVGFGGELWESMVSGGLFSGAASMALNGGSPIATSLDKSHWIEGTMSKIFVDGDAQETAMDPDLTSGERKILTDLDIAGLADIGWQINPSFTYATTPGDTDGDGDIDDTDLGTSFANYTGPVGAAGGKSVADGDTDGDGDVDDSDLGTSFAGYTGPLSPTTVPEPASAALLTLGALLGLRRRRDVQPG